MTETTEFLAADESVATDKKKLVVVGGVVAALVLGGGGYLLLGGGGSADDAALAPIPHHTYVKKTVAAPVKAKSAAAKPAIVPAVSAVKLGRDPFLALYTVPVAAPAAGTAPAPTAPTAAPTDTTTTTTTASSPYALKLTSIRGTDAKLYTFSVAGTSKTVLAAQRFGKYGELVVLAYVKDAKGNPIGALIQVGDDDPVGVKVGEKITVL